VANQRPDAPLRFLVLSSAPRLTLTYTDWKQSTEVSLRRPLGRSGVVEFTPAPAWRHHPLWFQWQLQDPFTIRLFRLALHTPDGSPAEAEIRYLGSSELPTESFYRRSVIRAELPRSAPAGGRSTLVLAVRNDGDRPWRSDDVLPVYVSYQMACAGLAFIEGPRAGLREKVAPGETFAAHLEVEWPAVETTCDLKVDLVVEGVTWFAAETGAPLARASVEIGAAP